MRLNKHQIDAITTVIKNVFGQDARITLFGSRLNDHAKGGGIDLLVTLDHPIDHPALDYALNQAFKGDLNQAVNPLSGSINCANISRSARI